jgi:ubiquinone/menaquinone biosynthesis C-methylase UbiE
MQLEEFFEKLYEKRFLKKLKQKNEIWKVLCSSFLQNYVNESDNVLDIGAGYCEFINNIRCAKKYAVDLNRDTKRFANPDVTVFNCRSTDVSPLEDSSLDVVFMSNFLEHSKTKDEMLETLLETSRVLKPGGKLIVLQPNIRYTYKAYWDYFDHYIPLSDRSLLEALEIMDFEKEEVIPKFLPYSFDSFKGDILYRSFFAKMYLKLPFVRRIFWRIMGKQMFVVSRKRA